MYIYNIYISRKKHETRYTIIMHILGEVWVCDIEVNNESYLKKTKPTSGELTRTNSTSSPKNVMSVIKANLSCKSEEEIGKKT